MHALNTDNLTDNGEELKDVALNVLWMINGRITYCLISFIYLNRGKRRAVNSDYGKKQR